MPGRFYAGKERDEKAAAEAAHKELISTGRADLDARAGGFHRELPWEGERVEILRQIEATPFLQGVRGGLLVSCPRAPCDAIGAPLRAFGGRSM